MFAADARKHTPGKNAEKENFSMRILVCDDDAAFAGQLAEKIEAIVKPQMPRSTVDCATDAALLRALPLAKYDLAFLDIDMGPLNGVDLAHRLHELRPDMLLIFVTNYVEYSLQGYEVQAFRYLLKAEMPQKLGRYVQQALTAYRKTRDTVHIFCDGEDVELQPQQILYAEMSARKVCLHLQGADRALLYTTATMADLADLLENHGFVRTHKSVLVNILGVSVRDAFRFERDERPLSKKTIREYVLFANQVLHFANERYHSVQAEFKMPAKGARPRFVDCIHEDEVRKLMSEIEKCSMPEQAIVLSLLNTGVRRAELAGLTWSDFDFKECTVHVNKSLLVFRDFGYQHTATKESNDRYIDVAPEYMEFMQQYKEWWYTKKRLMGASWQRDMVKNKESKRESLMRLAGEEFVIIDDFGWPRNPDGYNALVKRVAKKAGLKDIHPHMFRHTFVSLLMSNPDIGVATVAAEAGHAQPSTTLMIYTQQYKKRRESIRNQLSRELYEK